MSRSLCLVRSNSSFILAQMATASLSLTALLHSSSSDFGALAAIANPSTAVVGSTPSLNFTYNRLPSSATEFFNLVGKVTNYSNFFSGISPVYLNSGTPAWSSATMTYGYTGATTNPIPSIAPASMTWYAEDCYSNVASKLDDLDDVGSTSMSITSGGHRKLL